VDRFWKTNVTREAIELGLKDAIIEALLDLVGQPMTDEIVQQIAERSEWAKVKFALDNDLEVEVVETAIGPQMKIVYDQR
jgi:hypothetical protein